MEDGGAFYWNVYNTVRLIKDLKKTPCLWDPKNHDYKRKEAKMKAYRRMAQAYGSTPLQVETKVAALKNQFRREQRRLEEQARSGVIKAPTWFGYKKLLFLLPYYHSRANTNRTGETLFESNTSTEETNFRNQLQLDWGDLIGQKQEDEGSTRDTAGDEEGQTSDMPSYAMEETKADRWTEELLTRRDEFATYGEYVGNEVRKMTARSQLVVKHLINNILYEGALGKFESVVVGRKEASSPPRPSSSSPAPGPSSVTIVKNEPEEYGTTDL